MELAQVVTTPVNWVLLTTDRTRASKDNRFVFTLFLLQQLKHSVFVTVRVVVVLTFRVAAVKEYGVVHWNTLTEVRLEAVNTHVQQVLQQTLVPSTGFWDREVNHGVTWLPQIPLPNTAVSVLDEVTLFLTNLEEW